jgi:hypothetical protein
MAQEATPETTGSARPTKYHGKQGEWTVLAPLKPGGADQLRELIRGERDTAGQRQAIAIGTLHDMRVAIVDNDSRMLFATVFDGAWDQYIDDFAADPETNAALERLFQTCEGFPGMDSPDVKDYFVKHQLDVLYFWTAYPEATVNQLKKGQQVLAGFEQMLDAAG